MPTSIPRRPAPPDSAQVRTQTSVTAAASGPRRKPSLVSRAVIGALAGSIAGGALAHAVENDAAIADCQWCGLDSMNFTVSGALMGAIVGGVLGALTLLWF